MLSLVLANLPLVIGGTVFVAIGTAFYVYGRRQYKKGVRDTEYRYHKADLEGARNVNKTAEDVIRTVGNSSTDELLNETNGWRDQQS